MSATGKSLMEQPELVESLTRPIIGIENRTALETFDIMADRIRRALTTTADDALRDDAEWLRQLALAMREVDQFHGHADHLERIASRLAIPSEPTEEMIEAGLSLLSLTTRGRVTKSKIAAIYKAMIERISNGVSE